MRGFRRWAPPEGSVGAASKLIPRSVAAFCRIARVVGFADDVERAASHRPVRQPRDVFPGSQQPVDRDEAVVRLMREVVAGRRGRAGNPAGGRLCEVRQLFERTAEVFQDSIEAHSHLERERVARRIIRWRRRAARIRNVVRMILRLEHVHHMRPERLRGLHDIGVRRIRFAAHGERCRGTVNRDARLHQRVHELRGGAEVGLIRREDEAARVAQLRGRQRGIQRALAASAASACATAGPPPAFPPRPPPRPAG